MGGGALPGDFTQHIMKRYIGSVASATARCIHKLDNDGVSFLIELNSTVEAK